jgi:hypothetical protein
MRGANSFQYGCFKGGRLVELLPFEHAECLTNDFLLVKISTGVDESLHKLVQRRRKSNGHGEQDSGFSEEVEWKRGPLGAEF